MAWGVGVEMSMPISPMTATASGLTTAAGSTPALVTSNRSPASVRNNASAIWLRHAFSVQITNTRLFIACPFLEAYDFQTTAR